MWKNSQFSVKLLLSDTQFSCLQEKDPKIRSLHEKVCGGLYKEFYFIENDILYRSIMDNGHKFSAAVIPEVLTGTVLVLGAQSIWSQWLSEDLCCNQKKLLLEGNEETCSGSLQNLCYLCKTKGSKNTIQKTNI